MDCRFRQHLRTDFFRHDRSHYSIPSAFVELEHLSIVTITVKFLRHHGAEIGLDLKRLGGFDHKIQEENVRNRSDRHSPAAESRSITTELEICSRSAWSHNIMAR